MTTASVAADYFKRKDREDIVPQNAAMPKPLFTGKSTPSKKPLSLRLKGEKVTKLTERSTQGVGKRNREVLITVKAKIL